MNTIILNNIDPTILEMLQVLSQRHNRTLEEEVTAIITKVAEVETVSFKTPRQVFRSKLEQVRSQHGDRVLSDSAELLREDRRG
jgi:plasmid stability protein